MCSVLGIAAQTMKVCRTRHLSETLVRGDAFRSRDRLWGERKASLAPSAWGRAPNPEPSTPTWACFLSITSPIAFSLTT